MNKAKFSKSVKMWRARKGLSLREAALLLGVNKRTWEGWEYGRTIPEGIALAVILKRIS